MNGTKCQYRSLPGRPCEDLRFDVNSASGQPACLRVLPGTRRIPVLHSRVCGFMFGDGDANGRWPRDRDFNAFMRRMYGVHYRHYKYDCMYGSVL